VVEQRPVRMGARQGPNWIVKSGVSPGERIIVEGLLKARGGAVVKPTVVTPTQASGEDDSAPAHGTGK